MLPLGCQKQDDIDPMHKGTTRTESHTLLLYMSFDIANFLNVCFYSFAGFPVVELYTHRPIYLAYDTDPAKHLCHMKELCWTGLIFWGVLGFFKYEWTVTWLLTLWIVEVNLFEKTLSNFNIWEQPQFRLLWKTGVKTVELTHLWTRKVVIVLNLLVTGSDENNVNLVTCFWRVGCFCLWFLGFCFFFLVDQSALEHFGDRTNKPLFINLICNSIARAELKKLLYLYLKYALTSNSISEGKKKKRKKAVYLHQSLELNLFFEMYIFLNISGNT